MTRRRPLLLPVVLAAGVALAVTFGVVSTDNPAQGTFTPRPVSTDAPGRAAFVADVRASIPVYRLDGASAHGLVLIGEQLCSGVMVDTDPSLKLGTDMRLVYYTAVQDLCPSDIPPVMSR